MASSALEPLTPLEGHPPSICHSAVLHCVIALLPWKCEWEKKARYSPAPGMSSLCPVLPPTTPSFPGADPDEGCF